MTATEIVWAVESSVIGEAEALRRAGVATMATLYRMAILELAPQVRGRWPDADPVAQRAAEAA